jgi:RimJ/RimL family protein N-acetyltransferase/aryl carrier-like protein
MTVTASRREEHRGELAAMLDLDVADLPDAARLAEDLTLDSLDMMNLTAWLETRGIRVESARDRPTTVGDVLSLLDSTTQLGLGGLSIRTSDGTSLGPAQPPTMPTPRRDPLVPVLETPALRRTPLQPNDVPLLYGLAVRPENCFRWRYHGTPPSPERFTEELWAHVLTQYVVRRVDDDQLVGHVAYGANQNTSHAYLGALFHPKYTGAGVAAELVALFARHLFQVFPLRKLYMEIPGFNWDQLRSGEGRHFHTEGVLRGHVYYAGRHWDQHICAVYPPDRVG